MAPPDLYKAYHAFSWPNSSAEMRYLMQRNDVFIVSAIMAGLISRVIWIRPDWYVPDDKDDVDLYDDTMVTNGIGLYHHLVEGKETVSVCECSDMKNVTQSSEAFKCVWANLEDDSQEEIEEPEKCQVKKEYQAEVLGLDKALTLQASGTWLRERDQGLILDIDEDFYGCQSGYLPLTEARVSLEWIEMVDEILSLAFCPDSAEDERKINSMLMKQVRTLHLKCARDDDGTCLGVKRAYETQIVNYGIKYAMEQRCKNLDKDGLSELILAFVRLMLKLTLAQSEALRQVGFCFATSPQSYDDTAGRINICHGANDPNSTMVTWYSPTPNDIRRYTKELTRFLSSTTFPRPGLVSICRSVRDGYTPREYAGWIESDILRNLMKSFNLDESSIYYDEFLLGLRKGWASRSISNFFID